MIRNWSEEILFKVWSSGWNRDMPVTLITYPDGKKDLHIQTGDHYPKALELAKEYLKKNNLAIDQKSETIYPSGIYHAIRGI